ncbi:MAG: glycosyltransferase [Chitinivibrionia bacterium]|nr:glycosyltransferase [Chitinivibrionia bacterium]
METKISVIIPVYNVERYLERCINSILSQTFTDFECILVDDGSPDSCPAICDEYAERDKRIKVIHQKNAGTAYARDAGIKSAKGEFLSFVDSDDWIENNALEVLYKKQQETDADIVLGNVKYLYKNYNFIFKQPDIPSDIPPLEYLFSTPHSPHRGMCGRIYRSKFYHTDLYIPKSNIGEDFIINTQIFSRLGENKIANVNAVVYMYDQKTSGITQRKKYYGEPYYENSGIACRLWIKEFLEKNNLYTEKVKDGFLFDFIIDGIFPYIRQKKKITKNEADIFYTEFYSKCNKINKISFWLKIIIPVYRKSLYLGYVYVHVLNFLSKMKLILKGAI